MVVFLLRTKGNSVSVMAIFVIIASVQLLNFETDFSVIVWISPVVVQSESLGMVVNLAENQLLN